MNQKFIAVAESRQVKEGRAKAVVVDGTKIALFRWQGKVYALKDQCPHQGAPLSDGFAKDGCAVCFYHDWKFKLAGGAFEHNPAVRIATYPVDEKEDKILLDVSEL